MKWQRQRIEMNGYERGGGAASRAEGGGRRSASCVNVCVCLWEGKRRADTFWRDRCDIGPRVGTRDLERELMRGSDDTIALDPTLEKFHARVAATLRVEWLVSNNTSNRFLKTRTTGTWNIWQFFHHEPFVAHSDSSGRHRVEDVLVALCSLAPCPSSELIPTQPVTADWHPDFNPYTSQLWWDHPPLMCQRGRGLPSVTQAAYSPVIAEAGKTVALYTFRSLITLSHIAIRETNFKLEPNLKIRFTSNFTAILWKRKCHRSELQISLLPIQV